MQRIFSTFPNSWPGGGLLLLRFVTATPLLVAAISIWSGVPNAISLFLRLIGAVSAALILLGLWTPFGATLQAMHHYLAPARPIACELPLRGSRGSGRAPNG